MEKEAKLRAWADVIQPSGEVCTSQFWSRLQDCDDKDVRWLSAVFNPHLSDRRDEGESFVPPDTSLSYMQKLQHLVQEEEKVKRQRIEHFRSVDFDTDNAGPLFPMSWASKIELAGQQVSPKGGIARAGAGSHLHPCPAYRAQTEVLMPV